MARLSDLVGVAAHAQVERVVMKAALQDPPGWFDRAGGENGWWLSQTEASIRW